MDIYLHAPEKVEKEAADKLDKGRFEALDIALVNVYIKSFK